MSYCIVKSLGKARSFRGGVVEDVTEGCPINTRIDTAVVAGMGVGGRIVWFLGWRELDGNKVFGGQPH